MKFVVLIFVGVSFASAQNYCAMRGCERPQLHIACNNNGQFGRNCITPKSIQLTQAQMKRILDGHNQRRNLVALGGLRPFPPAARMAQMKWDNELAKLAMLNTRQCEIKHDDCRNTSEILSNSFLLN
jgi:uncharacterized protein YkwD